LVHTDLLEKDINELVMELASSYGHEWFSRNAFNAVLQNNGAAFIFSTFKLWLGKQADCYGALAMRMIGCTGPPTPSKIRMYHRLVVAQAFLAIFKTACHTKYLPRVQFHMIERSRSPPRR
jgi:hypothetical protein